MALCTSAGFAASDASLRATAIDSTSSRSTTVGIPSLAKVPDEAPDARVPSREADLVDEVLPDRHRIAPDLQGGLDAVAIRLTRTRLLDADGRGNATDGPPELTQRQNLLLLCRLQDVAHPGRGTPGPPPSSTSRSSSVNLNVTKTAAVVIDSGPQNTVRFGAGPLRFGSQVVARRINVFEPFRAVMAGRIGTWVARDCHIRVNCWCCGVD